MDHEAESRREVCLTPHIHRAAGNRQSRRARCRGEIGVLGIFRSRWQSLHYFNNSIQIICCVVLVVRCHEAARRSRFHENQTHSRRPKFEGIEQFRRLTRFKFQTYQTREIAI